MSYMVAVVVFFLGIATVMGMYFALTAEQPRPSWARERAAGKYSASSSLARSSLQWAAPEGGCWPGGSERTAAIDQDKPAIRQIHIALTRAGFNQVEQLAVYRAARVFSFVLAILTGLVIAHFYPRWWIPDLLGGAVIGYLLPGHVVKRLGLKRQLTIQHELPAILNLLVVTLEAGQGLLEAIRVVARETARQGRVLGKELATAAAEMSAGVSLEDAMSNLSQRTGVDDLKAIGAVFIQSKEIGGRLGPSLRAAAELLSAKRRLMAEEAAQKSSVKMLLPLVLLILPAMMLIILGPAIIQIFQMLMGAAA